MKKRRLASVVRFLLRAKRDPEAMARGLGIGVFVGFLPAVGFQMAIAILCASLFGGNRIAASAGTFVTNPLTALPVSAFSLWLGDLILPGNRIAAISMTSFSFRQLLDSPGELFSSFILGSLILGAFCGILSYLGMLVYFSRSQKKIRVCE